MQLSKAVEVETVGDGVPTDSTTSEEGEAAFAVFNSRRINNPGP